MIKLRKSDTLNRIFGNNASDLTIRKLENPEWFGLYIKSTKNKPFSIMRIYKLKSPDNEIKLKESSTVSYTFNGSKFIIENNQIFIFDKDTEN